jgi:hypothetical protein
MNHEQAAESVKRVTAYTIDFLARKHTTTHENIVAGLQAGDRNLLDQWAICFRLACDLVI